MTAASYVLTLLGPLVTGYGLLERGHHSKEVN